MLAVLFTKHLSIRYTIPLCKVKVTAQLALQRRSRLEPLLGAALAPNRLLCDFFLQWEFRYGVMVTLWLPCSVIYTFYFTTRAAEIASKPEWGWYVTVFFFLTFVRTCMHYLFVFLFFIYCIVFICHTSQSPRGALCKESSRDHTSKYIYT